MAGSGKSIEVWNHVSQKQLLRLDKKGSYGISCFTHSCLPSNPETSVVVYADGQDTQVFKVNPRQLEVTKLTKSLCHHNQIRSLPAFKWVQCFTEESQPDLMQVMGIDSQLNVIKINVETLSVQVVANLAEVLVH